jgi:hypothetical protein
MKLYRFSPIRSKEELTKAIEYTHYACFKMCFQIFGKYYENAGNIGIFCHFDDEFEYLTSLRKQITIESDNENNKYYRLIEPITIPAKNGIPETTYTYLYIRHPEAEKTQVGDVDFYVTKPEFHELKRSLLGGEIIKGVSILDRTDIDMIKLSFLEVDAWGFLRASKVTEMGKV